MRLVFSTDSRARQSEVEVRTLSFLNKARHQGPPAVTTVLAAFSDQCDSALRLKAEPALDVGAETDQNHLVKHLSP